MLQNGFGLLKIISFQADLLNSLKTIIKPFDLVIIYVQMSLKLTRNHSDQQIAQTQKNIIQLSPKNYTNTKEAYFDQFDQDFVENYDISQKKPASNHNLQGGIDIGEENNQTDYVEMDLFKIISSMARSKKIKAILGLVGAFMIHMVVGGIYRWNMIGDYISIYYDTDKQTPLGAPLAMLCAGFTIRLGYKLSGQYGSRSVMTVGVVVATTSIVIASTVNHFGPFLFFNNVLYSLSIGLLFLSPLKECYRFFPKMKLITNSIVLTGTGLGAFLFGSFNIYCFSDGDLAFQMDEIQAKELLESHFIGCMLKMSFVVLSLGLGGILMMSPLIASNKQREKQLKQLSMMPDRQSHFCETQKDAFKSRVFWIIFFTIFFSSSGSYYIISNFRNLLSKQHQQKTYLYWVLICGALGNGFSRLIWGFLSSRIGFKVIFTIVCILSILSYQIIIHINNQITYLLAYTIINIGLGGLMVIVPNVSLLIFGKKVGQSIYGYFWLAFSLSNFFQYFITILTIKQQSQRYDYTSILYLFSLTVAISLIICLRQTLQGPWENSPDLIQFYRVSKKE